MTGITEKGLRMEILKILYVLILSITGVIVLFAGWVDKDNL